MKTVKELRDAVLAANNLLDIGQGITMTYDETDDGRSDLDIKHNGNLIAWVGSMASDDDLLNKRLSFNSSELFHRWRSFAFLGHYLNLLVDEQAEKGTREHQAPQSDPDKYHLSGMVEAYEKLLIGRGVNITP